MVPSSVLAVIAVILLLKFAQDVCVPLVLSGLVFYALDPVVEAIHKLVDEVGDGGHADNNLHTLTMELVLLALGDSLLGGPLSSSLGLQRSAGREIAAQRLAQSFAAWEALIKTD